MSNTANSSDFQKKAHADLIDSYDEELEMELDDDLLDELILAVPSQGA